MNLVDVNSSMAYTQTFVCSVQCGADVCQCTGLCIMHCFWQANLEAELVRLQRESREKQNVINEKEEEMYELETRIEKQVFFIYTSFCSDCTGY